jgi:hypothetical protein
MGYDFRVRYVCGHMGSPPFGVGVLDTKKPHQRLSQWGGDIERKATGTIWGGKSQSLPLLILDVSGTPF